MEMMLVNPVFSITYEELPIGIGLKWPSLVRALCAP
jgi:hypothetical protein